MRYTKVTRSVIFFLAISFCSGGLQGADPTERQLERWLKRFPQADTNEDGVLTAAEAEAFRKQRNRNSQSSDSGGGAPRTFKVHPGWDAERFPDHAICYLPPEDIKAIYAKQVGEKKAVVSYEKPQDGALRIVGTGHSFMGPGYRSLPLICRAAGFEQPLYTHTGGGMTGSTRYKWEQENGIFEFDGKPEPKLLASIANAEWEAMMWGPYFQDRTEYYSCWINFCLKYQPDMKFYLSDAWPQLYQLNSIPESEDFFTEALFEKLGQDRSAEYVALVNALRTKHSAQVFIIPTSDAMVLAAKHYLRGELPGIDGINRIIGGKEHSLWRDKLGHLGPDFERLEGYVFYATLYGRSPELITHPIDFQDNETFPGPELDRIFRKIAWNAVTNNALSGIEDKDRDGKAD